MSTAKEMELEIVRQQITAHRTQAQAYRALAEKEDLQADKLRDEAAKLATPELPLMRHSNENR